MNVNLLWRHGPWRLGAALVALVLAILMSGLVAYPAAANQRAEAKGANDFIAFCVSSGGDPTVIDGLSKGRIIVYCDGLPGVGGKSWGCVFSGTKQDCWWSEFGAPAPDGNLPQWEPVSQLEPLTAEQHALTNAYAASISPKLDAPAKEAKAHKAKGKHRHHKHRR